MPMIGWVLILVAAGSIIGVVFLVTRERHHQEEWFRPGHPHWPHSTPVTPAAPLASSAPIAPTPAPKPEPKPEE